MQQSSYGVDRKHGFWFIEERVGVRQSLFIPHWIQGVNYLCHSTENLHGHLLCIWVTDFKCWMVSADCSKQTCDAGLIILNNKFPFSDCFKITM